MMIYNKYLEYFKSERLPESEAVKLIKECCELEY